MAALLCLSCLGREEEEVTELDYRHCSLDDVPNEIFAYERTLEALRLDCNNIRDLPRPLFHCHGLKDLSLADNELGNIPTAVSSLAQLVSLDVSKNVLIDLPETIKQCKHLAVIQASVNPLQKIPEGCTQLVSLTELYLSDCLLEYIPANFGRLSKLKILELRENSLNSLPKSMERLVNITRIDLSQNQFTEVPDTLNSMIQLEELLIDGNKIKLLPSFLGKFSKLKHLDASFNQLEVICPEIGHCSNLVDLTLSSNDLKQVPESLESLTNLVTLKLDDNQIEKLPDNLGRMAALEELYAAENFLTYLPPSIGWLRRLHTLNVDENDLEELPPEIGSCRQMKILSVHGNKLSGLPDEVGHMSQLAVLTLAGNYIPHLPVSFVKLKSITAIWLANNQTKPLVQLNTDIDPHTGMKVLTNFLLPQQPDPDRAGDNNSDSGSFHASVWEEERSKRSLVKWAGEDTLDHDKTGNLRRAPTPFPKEMRAMAKKVQNMKEKRAMEVERNSKRKHNRNRNFKDRLDTAGFDISHQVTANGVSEGTKMKAQPADVISRDSGVISPSEQGQDTESEMESTPVSNTLQVHDTPTVRVNNNNYLTPVKAEIVTNELDNDEDDGDDDDKFVQKNQGAINHQPPPYHIAATRSKHAGNFFNIQNQQGLLGSNRQNNNDEEHFYENQDTMKRQVNGHSLERKSSFLSDGTLESISESETSTAPSSLQTIIRAPYVLNPPSQPESELLSSANNLRKVSEQILNTSRTRNSLAGLSRPGSVALSPRPSSQQSNSSTPSGREHRPNSFAGPPNTVGLPVASPAPNNQSNNTDRDRDSTPSGPKFSSKLPKLSVNYPESNGLLSTISQAALSDDESPPATHKPNSHKFNTAILSKPSPPGGRDRENTLPNYENVEKQEPSPSPLMMTQGQFRAAASQAKVATIPAEESNTYINMGLRKHVSQASTPLATSSPSGIPRYTPTVK